MLATDFQAYFGSPDCEEVAGGAEALLTCPKCSSPRKLYVSLVWKTKVRNNREIRVPPGSFICHKCQFKGMAGEDQIAAESSMEDTFRQHVQFLHRIQTGQSLAVPVSSYDLSYMTVSVFDYPEVLAYALSRKFTESMLVKYGVRAGFDGPLRRRLVIPNKWSQDGVNFICDFYVARATYPTGLRYYNPVDSASKKAVFNLHNIEDNPPMVILCEGAISAIFAGSYGVATQSKSVSDEQIDMILAKKPKRIYLAVESDALQTNLELAHRLIAKGVQPYMVFLPAGQDPNDLYPNFAPLLRNAKKFSDQFAVSAFVAQQARGAPAAPPERGPLSIPDKFGWLARKWAEANELRPTIIEPEFPTDFSHLRKGNAP